MFNWSISPNWVGTVVVGGSMFVNALTKIVDQGMMTLPQQISTARTLDEARGWLSEKL